MRQSPGAGVTHAERDADPAAGNPHSDFHDRDCRPAHGDRCVSNGDDRAALWGPGPAGRSTWRPGGTSPIRTFTSTPPRPWQRGVQGWPIVDCSDSGRGPHVGLPSLEVECDLCAGWSMEDDRTFLFRLRDGIVWQDLSPVRGRDLGADDVVYSYRRLLESRGGAGPLGAIELVEPAGPGEVRIRLADSDSDFFVWLADGRAKIVAREAVEANGDLKQGPTVGSGPWRMTDSIRSAFHRFERNATYFEEDLPFADALMMHIMPDASTRYAAFDVGTLDVHQPDPDEWGRLVQRRPDLRSTLVRESGVGLEVALNTSRSPFHDVDVRRAVFRAMDPWAAIDQTWSGTAYVRRGNPRDRA